MFNGGCIASLDGSVDPERELTTPEEELHCYSGRTRQQQFPPLEPKLQQAGMRRKRLCRPLGKKASQAERIKLRRGESSKKKE